MSLVVGFVASGGYGPTSRARRMAEALSARGDDVTVIARATESFSGDRQENGVRVVSVDALLRVETSFWIAATAMLLFLRASKRFDVVVLGGAFGDSTWTSVLPALFGTKVVVDLCAPTSNGEGQRALGFAAARALFAADAVLVSDLASYERLLASRVPARKVGIFVNLPPIGLVTRRKVEPRSAAKGPIRIVCHTDDASAARFVCEGLRRARERYARLSLVIVSNAKERLVSELARDLASRDDVTIVARVPGDEAAKALENAHLAVVPSLGQGDVEPPPTLFETLAFGVATIACRTPAIVRLFGDALIELVEPGDPSSLASALARLADDRARRAQMIGASIAWDEEFGWHTNRRMFLRTVDALGSSRPAKTSEEKPAATS